MNDARQSPPALQLYGTGCCHLCEQAQAILTAVGASAEHIEIVHDDALLEIYGTRIPVLKRLDTGSELGWPFEAARLRQWLA